MLIYEGTKDNFLSSVEQDTAHARIYDRLLEMCVPVQFKGESFRKRTAQEKLGRMQKRIKEEMR